MGDSIVSRYKADSNVKTSVERVTASSPVIHSVLRSVSKDCPEQEYAKIQQQLKEQLQAERELYKRHYAEVLEQCRTPRTSTQLMQQQQKQKEQQKEKIQQLR